MAARNDRALRTASELVLAQAAVLSAPQAGLVHLDRARLVVLLDDLLDALEHPTNARHQSWSNLLVHRGGALPAREELAAELAEESSRAVLERLCAARTAELRSALAGELPASVTNQYGHTHLVDYLRAVLLEMAVLAARAPQPGLLQPAALRQCVRSLSQALGERFAGQTIEVRIPPASAVQVGAFGEGPTHTRGTPPNVVETDELTWLLLATGATTLDEALAAARVQASGSHWRALERMLPVVGLATPA